MASNSSIQQWCKDNNLSTILTDYIVSKGIDVDPLSMEKDIGEDELKVFQAAKRNHSPSVQSSSYLRIQHSSETLISLETNLNHGNESSVTCIKNLKHQELQCSQEVQSDNNPLCRGTVKPKTKDVNQQQMRCAQNVQGNIQAQNRGLIQQQGQCDKEVQGEARPLNKDQKETSRHHNLWKRQFNDSLEKAGLMDCFKEKITIKKVMQIGEETQYIKEPSSPDLKLLDYVRRLVSLDYNARHKPGQYVTVASTRKDCKPRNNLLAKFKTTVGNMSPLSQIHPQDYLLLAFSCCANDLKHLLVHKLFLCRLAIPFLYPSPDSLGLIMTLSPLKFIDLSWKNSEGKLKEINAASAPQHVFSFCRVGKTDMCSKSRLLNEIMTDDVHHTFFHFDCPHGTIKRIVCDGVVEGGWYLPCGKKSDTFDSLTLFLNLRGEATEHLEQMHILAKMSTTLILFVALECLEDEKLYSLFGSLFEIGCKVIVLLTKNKVSDNTMIETKLEALSANWKDEWPSTDDNVVPTFSEDSATNYDEVKNTVRTVLREQSRGFSHSNLLDLSQSVDSKFQDETHRQVEMWSKGIIDKIDQLSIVECRKKHFLLQDENWCEWSRLLKKKSRPSMQNGSLTNEGINAIKEKMKMIRKEQLESLSQPSSLIKSFMGILAKVSIQEQIFFLKNLRLMLNELSNSKASLFIEEYNSSWSNLQKQKGKLKSDELKLLEQAVQTAEKNLSRASLGLENFFREISQMYEVIHAENVQQLDFKIDTELEQQILQMPSLVARLLLAGHSFELLDGEASNIPINWVKAMFEALSALIQSKKIFIVSVLGVQSSGKSTLLNTMFGLEFAVSAGRCTKGVNMQMLPVKPEANLPFHYVFIIDTEGLRAQELGMTSHDRDNELATFAIGLGDVTIMNIKGENYAEIKDVIQIAVHAFLRMELVSKHPNNHKCIFIHQNVPAVSAGEKLKHSRHKLKENLDEMTTEAAQQEGHINISTFDQIIKFDCFTDVFFFPDLWKGDPPMAPANPGYSEAVFKVREKIFSVIAKEQNTFTNISHVFTKINDLWEGILADDFVFSFRNSLEVKAYLKFEEMYQKLLFEADEKLFEWERKNTDKLKGCSTDNSVELKQRELDNSKISKIEEITSEFSERLKTYCKDSDHPNITIQWEQRKINSLREELQLRSTRLTESINNLAAARRGEIFSQDENKERMGRIMSEACKNAKEMRQKKMDSMALKERFEPLWNDWSMRLASSFPPAQDSPTTIASEITLELFNHFRAHHDVISKTLKDNPITSPLDIRRLAESFSVSSLKKHHLSIVKVAWYEKVKGTVDHILETVHLKDFKVDKKNMQVVQKRFDKVMTDADRIISKWPTIEVFKILTIKTLIKEFTAQLQDPIKENGVEINFMPLLQVETAVHVCRFAYPILCKMQKQFDDRHGARSKLKSYRETLWQLFINTYYEKSDEIIAQDIIKQRLEEKVEQYVKKNASNKIVEKLKRMFKAKQYVLREVLTSLLRNKRFNDFIEYIESPKRCCTAWVLEKGKVDLMKLEPDGYSVVGNIARLLIEEFCTNIKDSLDDVLKHNKENKKMSTEEWIILFCKSASQRFGTTPTDYPVEKIRSGKGDGNKLTVTDFREFTNEMSLIIQKIESTLKETFKTAPPEALLMTDTIFSEALDSIWGCEELCPFCNEPCILGSKHEVAHQCLQHRVMGVKGYRGIRSGVITLETCNFAIASDDKSFLNGDTCGFVLYKDYKKVYPKWDIKPNPDSAISCPYWVWYLCRYENEHCNHFEMKKGKIPSAWRDVKEDRAKDSILKVYHD